MVSPATTEASMDSATSPLPVHDALPVSGSTEMTISPKAVDPVLVVELPKPELVDATYWSLISLVPHSGSTN